MSARLPVPQRWLNANGDAEAGLEVYTYSAGTLTDKTTYYEAGLSTPHTNPILLDASGYPPAPIYGSGVYRVIVKDSGGVTLYDEDNMVFDTLALDENGDLTLAGDIIMTGGTLTINGATVTADAYGNIAFNGATIPSDVSQTFRHIFYSDDHCTFESSSDSKISYEGNGIYYRESPAEFALTSNNNGSVNTRTNTSVTERISVNGSPSAGDSASLVTTYSRDISTGSINIKTGGTYTATL